MIVTLKNPFDLIPTIQKYNKDIWGLTVFGHGSRVGDLGNISGNGINQSELLLSLDNYVKHKLARVYMMQCFSGFAGNLAFPVFIPQDNGAVRTTHDIANHLRNIGFPVHSGYYDQKPSYFTRVDWQSEWEKRAVRAWTYQGKNVFMIDW